MLIYKHKERGAKPSSANPISVSMNFLVFYNEDPCKVVVMEVDGSVSFDGYLSGNKIIINELDDDVDDDGCGGDPLIDW